MTTTAGVTVELRELARLQGTARNLRFSGLRRPLSTRAGSHISAHKGRGLEFDEVRHYQIGDDVRAIDWRITARRGRPHTRLYREERERPILVLADLNPGMFFGTRRQFKSVQVSQLTALAAWAAQQNGDRIGGVVIGADRFLVLPPQARQRGVMALLHALYQQQPRSPGDGRPGRLDQGLAKLAALTRPGSLVILLSDFRELTAAGERSLRVLTLHNDLLAGFVYDSLEAQPPAQGKFGFASLHRRLVLDTGLAEVQRQWREEFQRRREHLHQLGRQNNFPVLDISTEMEPAHILRQAIGRFRRQ